MMKDSRGYWSFLLRLWKSTRGLQTIQHASLESPLSGEQYDFATLEELFAFLEQLVNTPDSQDDKTKSKPEP